MNRLVQPQEDNVAAPSALDLSAAELDVVGSVFAQILSEVGVDGNGVFASLRQGTSFADALSLPRGVVELLYARAYRWASIGRFDKARSLFQVLCLLESLSADYWVGYGVCLKMTDTFDAAATAFHSAHRCRPDWAVPHFHLLDLAMRRSRWGEAAEALRAFDQSPASDLPADVVAQASRLRLALALRLGQPSASETPTDALK